jgi:hypothetical protein
MLLRHPLIDSDGRLLGTVCHFNDVPVPLTDNVVTALDDLAPIIAKAAFQYSQSKRTLCAVNAAGTNATRPFCPITNWRGIIECSNKAKK